MARSKRLRRRDQRRDQHQNRRHHRPQVWSKEASLARVLKQELLKNGNKMMRNLFHSLWSDQQGQDIAEYSVMVAVILVIVVGTVRLIGSNAGGVFSQVGSTIQ